MYDVVNCHGKFCKLWKDFVLRVISLTKDNSLDFIIKITNYTNKFIIDGQKNKYLNM